jgi:hypothetical protein
VSRCGVCFNLFWRLADDASTNIGVLQILPLQSVTLYDQIPSMISALTWLMQFSRLVQSKDSPTSTCCWLLRGYLKRCSSRRHWAASAVDNRGNYSA